MLQFKEFPIQIYLSILCWPGIVEKNKVVCVNIINFSCISNQMIRCGLKKAFLLNFAANNNYIFSFVESEQKMDEDKNKSNHVVHENLMEY